jgi:hypothetical protein
VIRLDDLPPEQRAWIRRQLEKAPELSEAQRIRLQLLFRGAADE